MSQLGFCFDMTACIGCRTCQIACKDKNNLKPGILFRQVKTFEVGKFPQADLYHYSGTCNHCATPRCVEGCPTTAMHKLDNGIVAHDQTKCIGCRYCTWNCPYSIPQFIEELKIVKKCDMCQDLLDQGLNPACVDSCPMRVLKWGDIEQLQSEYGKESTQDLPILPASSVTNPSLLIRPKNVAKQTGFRKKEA